jgi:hemoglobin-like flavoprotein
MDARKIALVQESFEKMASRDAEVSEIFYAELFAIDPSLRGMFVGDMRDQNRKLFAALNSIARSIHAPHQFLDDVEGLAKKHIDYGVRPEHYTYFGNALLRTLKKQLGTEFTAELCDAWAEAFKTVTKIMKEAAHVQNRGAA